MAKNSRVTRVIDYWDGEELVFTRTTGEKTYSPTPTAMQRFRQVIVDMCVAGRAQGFGSYKGPHYRFDIKEDGYQDVD